MLKQLVIVLTFLILGSNNGLGQCSFNLPDTVCPQNNFTVNGSGYLTADQCSGRLDSLLNIQNIPTLLSGGTYQFKMIKENNRYFILTNVYGSTNTRRYEFNSKFSSLLNTADNIALNDSCAQSIGFDMVKVDSIKWIGFKADFNTNLLYKITFDSLTDNNLTFELVGSFGLSNPVRIKIIGDYVFVPNNGNNTISKIHFTPDFQNVIDSAVINGPFVAPRQLDVIYDCNSNNYYGYISNYGGTNLVRMDFGTSLSNNNPAFEVINTTVGNSFGLKMYWQKNAWYSFVVDLGLHLKLLKFGNPENPNPTVLLDTISPLLNSTASIDLLVDSSILQVISGFSMTKFTFSSNCNISNSWSEGTDSVTLNFQADSGYQFVEIANQNNDHVTYSIYDSVFLFVPKPIVDFAVAGTCEGLPVQFTDESSVCYGSITGWLWDFGDATTSSLQNPFHTYAAGNLFNVTLTVYTAKGDSNTITKQITLVPKPIANFTIASSQVCAFSNVLFNDQSTAPGDSLVSWLWAFGDGNSSTAQNAQYSYSTAGNFQLQLFVTNSNGCTDSLAQAMQVLETPLANFSATGTCLNGTVLFQNLTDSLGALVVDYSWFFGNGASSVLPNPSYSYAAIDSIYDVQLIAKSPNGCATSFHDSIVIAAPAAVSFSTNKDTVCQNESIVFINETTTSNQSIVSKAWYFSDGYIAQNTDTVIHSFNQGGTYLASLVITTATSCDTTYSKTIFVLENPTANFVFTNVCLNDSNLFVNTSVAVAGDNIISYAWNFGDTSSIVNSTTTYHQYSNAGQYPASITIITNKGCSDSLTQLVSVYDLPIANFIPAQVLCSDSANQFLDFSFVNSNDTINKWWWNFGDANTAVVKNPTNNYTDSGNYMVQLVIETQKGCYDTIAKPIFVKQSPSPSFSFDSTCFGNLTQFDFINLSPGTGLINAWNWNFGEFGTANSTLQNPTHQYLQSGTYLVTVTATDTNQCKADFTQSIKINDLPKPGFLTTNACEAANVLFTDTSTVSGSSITQWSWLINGSIVSISNSANYIFSQSGIYPVQLVVTSDDGCSNSIIKPVEINNLPAASFISTPAYATPGQPVSFLNTSTNATAYEWTFGDGGISNLLSPTHIFSDTNIYVVTLTAYSDKGCTDTSNIFYSVLIPVVEIAIFDASYIIKNNLMSVTAQVVNLGNVDITSYDLIARFDETPVLVESPTQPITVSNPNLFYTFKSKIVINENFDPTYFCIEASKPNGLEDISFNNTKCKSIDNTLQLLNLAPNPVADVMQLYLNSPIKQDLNLLIYDMQGKQMTSLSITVKKGFSYVNVDVNGLSNGLYVLRIDNSTVSLKQIFEKQ